MKRILTASLAWLILMALPLGIQAATRRQIQHSRFKIQNSASQGSGALRATATAHGITYTWTASSSTYTGLGYNLYVGTTPGGESATPANSALMAVGCSGATCNYTYTNVVSLASYYAVLATCVPSGSGNTCSAKTAEVAATIPLAAGDIASPTGFSGSAF